MIKFHRIGAYILRHLYEIRASLDRKADIFLFPVIDILTFGLLTVYIDKLEQRPGIALAILGAVIFWTLVTISSAIYPFLFLRTRGAGICIIFFRLHCG